MATHNTDTLAVLIDADNAQAAIVTELLAEVSSHGTAIIKRAYGDWTTPNLRGWKEVLLSHAIQPRQQFSYTTGRNATDSALIIDVMDLLHTKSLGGFCIVSSDSDYTHLATRIREAGAAVVRSSELRVPEARRAGAGAVLRGGQGDADRGWVGECSPVCPAVRCVIGRKESERWT